MAHDLSASLSFSGLTRRTESTCKSLLLFALAFLALGTGSRALAAATTTTLATTSAGSAVTTVPALTVVTLTATVKAGTTPVTVGQVNFCDATVTYCTDIHLLGTAQLTSAGTAELKFIPGVGSHSYKAVFLGTSLAGTMIDAASSSSDSALTVTASGKLPTTTTIAASGIPGNFALTASVTGVANSPEQGSPTGTVSFLDTSNGNSLLGSAALGVGTTALIFLNSQSPSVGDEPENVAVGDFNGDGRPDLAIANYSSNTVTVLLGNGDGTFTLKSTSPTGNYPWRIAVADFNGDGKQDLVIVNQGISPVTVLLGNGDGTFTAAASPTSVSNLGMWGVATGDFNGDGIPDLAITNAYGLTILLGNGDGTFAGGRLVYSAGMRDLVVGDFNGDGKPDIAALTYYEYAPGYQLAVFLNNGEGGFTEGWNSAFNTFVGIAEGDFYGDGNLDLAGRYESPYESNSWVYIFQGHGTGIFTPESVLPLAGPTDSMAVGDFNGDGNADLAVLSAVYPSYALSILEGSGSGTFTVEPPLVIPASTSLAAGDFNGDGVSDLAITDTANAATVLLAQPTQTATATVSGLSLPANSGTHEIEASYPGDSDFDSSVSGTTAINTGQIAFSKASLNFGSENVGDSTGAQALTLTNISTSTLTILSIKLTGADASGFVTSNTCISDLTNRLAAGASCQIGVRFAPNAVGAATAALTVTFNAGSSPQSVALSGTGIAAPQASLSLSATNLSFGNIDLNDSSAAQGVTVANTGSVALYFGSIKLTGADPSSFVTSNTCGSGLAVGASCTIGVRFAPVVQGALTAAVTLTDNTSTSPQSITLTGTAIGATATVSATSLSFGNVTDGYSSAVQTVTLTSTGTVPLYIDSIQLIGVDSSSFVSSNNCPTSLTGSCTISVRFVPSAAGAANATITVTDSAPTSPQTIALSGTGVTPQPAFLSLSATSLSFGTETVGTSTAAQAVTVTNTGIAAIYFSSIVLGGANASSFVSSNTCGTTIAVGASCKIGVRFDPTTTGSLAGTVTLTDNASGSPQVITLSGMGTD